MISSRECAPRHGPGRLLVDGTDDHLYRKATIAFRPTAHQERSMLGLLRVLAEVYNAGLQERREAWSRCGRSVRDQFQCTVCGHEQHADLNAAENIAARGRACETAWRTAGSPRLTRRKLTLRPRNETTEPPTAQAA